MNHARITTVLVAALLLLARSLFAQPRVKAVAASTEPNPSGQKRGGALHGPDMTFCELYGLSQFGREGDIVGLSVAQTEWNIGDEPVPWVAPPSPDHPFIVANLYRLMTVDGSERFEQIGMQWALHGFCALDPNQCGPCVPTGCVSLGIGCTNPNSSGLMASQNGLGPR